MNTFTETLNGTLWGLMRWGQWDTLRAQIVAAGEPWYFYAVGEDLPAQPLSGEKLAMALDALDALLRKEHRDAHLGIVYVDDLTAPSLMKIYDPSHMGGCGGGKGIPPGWVVSRQPPETIKLSHPHPENRRRWWRELQARLAA